MLTQERERGDQAGRCADSAVGGQLFNYTNVGLAPRDKGSYFAKGAKGWAQPNRPHLLSVEDPQDEDNDVRAPRRACVPARRRG